MGPAVRITAKDAAELTTWLSVSSPLLNAIAQPVVVVDASRQVLFWNAGAEQLYGYSAQEALGRPVGELLVPAGGELDADFIMAAVCAGDVWTGEFEVRCRDGSSRPVLSTNSPLFDLSGALIAVINTATDITADVDERRVADTLRAALRVTARAIVRVGNGGLIESWNPAAEQLFGWTASEAVGMPASALVPPELAEENEQLLARVADGHRVREIETMRLHKDGSRLEVALAMASVDDHAGRQHGIAIVLADLREPARLRRDLADQHSFWSSVVEHSSEAAFVLDRDGIFTWVSPTVATLTGHDPQSLVGTSIFASRHAEDLSRFRDHFAEVLAAPGPHPPIVVRATLGAARGPWAEYRFTNLLDLVDVGGIVGHVRDVSGRVDAEAALAESEFRYRSIVTVADEGIAVLDAAGVVEFANPAFAAMLAIETDNLIGTIGLRYVEPTQRAVIQAAWSGRSWPDGRVEVMLVRSDGAGVPVLLSVNELAGMRRLVMATDLGPRKAIEDQLADLLDRDALTGLPGAAAFGERADAALTGIAEATGAVGVIVLDIDALGLVNSTHGRPAGDDVLKAVASRLLAATEATDMVARIDGDEFVVLRPRVDDAAAAAELARSLLSVIAHPLPIDGVVAIITASAGVAVARTGRAGDLLRQADSAMHQAKDRGRAQVRVYQPAREDDETAKQARDPFELLADLRVAIDTGQLALAYQPVVLLPGMRPTGAEALLRWAHPTRGALAPADFLPLAESTGLIIPLGRWVLREACRQAAAWRLHAGQGSGLGHVAVNLSARQLLGDDDILEVVRDALESAGLPPRALLLEVTENALVDDLEAARRVLGNLKALGVQVALDDFGTGFSNFSYLKRFPVDLLKIDRSFVSGLGTATDDSAIVASILSMARLIGVETIAEGVETDDQLRHLVSLGCRLAQGHLFSPAVFPDALPAVAARLMRANRDGAVGRAPAAGRSGHLTPRSMHLGGRSSQTALPEDDAVTAKILALHATGASAYTIAAKLNQDGVPPTTGRRWHANTIVRVIEAANRTDIPWGS